MTFTMTGFGRTSIAMGAMLLAAVGLLGACAQEANKTAAPSFSRDDIAQINAVFEDWDSKSGPGGVVAVVYGDKTFVHGYGMANLETGMAMSSDTRLHVASISKQFTAYAAGLLINEGKLSLDDRAQDYVPAVKQIKEPLMIEQLIHHTSGLRDQWSLASMAGIRPSEVISQRDILTMASQQNELNFEPGSAFVYSNMGYSVLAEVVGKVAGAPFPQVVDEQIFTPLGMDRTTVFSIRNAPLEGRSMSYDPDGETYRQVPLNFDNYGATSLQTTANDMTRWLRNLLSDAPLGGPAMKQMILQQAVLNNGREVPYAFALELSDFHGLGVVEHGGSDAGFRAHVMYIPEKDFGVAVLSNRSDSDTSIRARKIVSALLLADTEISDPRAALGDIPSAETRRAYEGEFHLADGPVMNVTASEDGLVMASQFWPGLELTQASEGRFITLDDDVPGVLAFDTSVGDGYDEFVFSRGPHEFRGRRITAPNILPDYVGEYVGKYESATLDTSYFIDLTEEGLKVRHWRAGPGQLRPIGADDFAVEGGVFGHIRFIRDGSGKIAAFRGSDRRAKNVPFLRVSDQSAADAGLPE
ncbi:serine hydrolase domain-containing protein [Marinicaulis aureus]|uniref:Serine hydrolase domain-containing protein n=1 Tax=Hyphococcus aureus TaxID=2666033 RepID=A0ABW1KZR2_9PROT